MCNIAIICLGANTPDASERLAGAALFLSSVGTLESRSGQFPTAPEHTSCTRPYLNEVLQLRTDMGYDELRHATKGYESRVRALLSPESAGLVNLDIDIVIYAGEVKRAADASACYFKEGLSRMATARACRL